MWVIKLNTFNQSTLNAITDSSKHAGRHFSKECAVRPDKTIYSQGTILVKTSETPDAVNSILTYQFAADCEHVVGILNTSKDKLEQLTNSQHCKHLQAPRQQTKLSA